MHWAHLLNRVLVASMVFVLAPAPVLGQRGVRLERHVVSASDSHQLVLWAKRPAAAPRGAILLLHGATWSALPNFDLQVAGKARVSLMDRLVAEGYAAYALDQRSYGATGRDSSGWTTPDRAVDDAAVVLRWIAARGPAPALLGYSQGAMTTALTAQRHPQLVTAAILYGFPINVAEPYSAVADPATPRRIRTTAAGAASDFISPESTPAGVQDAYVAEALRRDSVRADWRSDSTFGQIDPAKLRVPVLLINGERDPYAIRANLPAFMARLSGIDRSWVVLRATDHAAHLERYREFADAVVHFLDTRAPGRRKPLVRR